ncbi:MAG: hypothetical protein LUC29_05180, partial [Acidaminococcaceae bacterium]|nr:hypothetical protein [Acidaminococcaceae bacterium]
MILHLLNTQQKMQKSGSHEKNKKIFCPQPDFQQKNHVLSKCRAAGPKQNLPGCPLKIYREEYKMLVSSP